MSLPQSKYPPRQKAGPKPEPVPQLKSLPQSKITAQGQISVPAEVRRELGLSPGSVLEWEVTDGTAVVRRVGKYTFEDMHRLLFPKPPKPHTLEELKAAIGEHLRKKHARR